MVVMVGSAAGGEGFGSVGRRERVLERRSLGLPGPGVVVWACFLVDNFLEAAQG